jgi:hypothetical protein
MKLIICHPTDVSAIWLHTQWKNMGVESCLVSVEELLMPKTWVQNISDKHCSFEITTHSGKTIKSTEIDFVVNRTQMVNALLWQKAAPQEKDYVQNEMQALLLGWLYSVQQSTKLFNPPQGYSLCGPQYSIAEWQWQAQKMGFTISENKNNTNNYLVIGEKVIGNNINQFIAKQCIALSKQVQSPILEITMDEKNHFIQANSFPELKTYGKSAIQILTTQANWK